MKKLAAVLGVFCMLFLSSCRVQPPEEGGSAAPDQPPPAVSPTQSGATPDDGEGDTANTPPPTPTETAPAVLTAQELAAFAQEWSESEAARFAGYDAFSLPRSYWFADYATGVELVPFIGADGADGSTEFMPDPDGTSTPVAAAAWLLGQNAEDLIVVDHQRTMEGLSRSMEALAEEKLTREVAFDRFVKAVQDIPALGEEMWYCVSAENTGYILMRHEGVYRLQRMAAMLEYARTPEFRVRIDFDRAVEAYGWVYRAPMPLNRDDQRVEGEITYFRTTQPGVSTMIELRTYFKSIFSDEIVDMLLAQNVYQEFEGALYAADIQQEIALPAGVGEVVRESESRVVYKVNVECVYELVGDKWVFTQFPPVE